MVDYTNKEKYFIPHGRLMGGGNCISGVKYKNNIEQNTRVKDNPKQDTISLENSFQLKQEKALQLFRKGESERINNEYDKADSLYHESLRLYEECEKLNERLAENLVFVGQKEKAKNITQEFRKCYADALFYTGMNHFFMNPLANNEKACEYYTKAKEMSPYIEQEYKDQIDTIEHI